MAGINASDARVKEVVEYALENGDDSALETFGMSTESLPRYKREYKTRFGDINDRITARKLLDKYSDAELRAILSSGERSHRDDNYRVNFEGDNLTIGVMSDLHIGSLYTRRENIFSAFDEMNRRGCSHIFIPGDITEGMSGRPGHVYELSHIGYHAQREEAIEILNYAGIPIIAIDGNHDRWYIKSNGAKIVSDIADNVPNMTFIGHDVATVEIAWVKIMLWHGEDGGCFDDKTEILTQAGWKLFSDLKYDDAVATMTKDTNEFQWQKPTHITNQNYSGKMIHFLSRTVDCMVTPDHGMWARVSDSYTCKRKKELKMPQKSHGKLSKEWRRIDAGDIVKNYSRQKWQFTQYSKKWDGEKTPEYVNIPRRESKNKGVNVLHADDVDIDTMAEFIAWYVTEGHASKKNVSISQYRNVNPENHNMIIDVAKRLGYNYGVSDKSITIHSVELSEWVKNECGHLSRNKFLPQWLKQCDADILNLVIDIMVLGDGWIRPGRDTYGYRSISKRLVNDFGEIAAKCGYAVTYSKDGETVTIRKTQSTPTVNSEPEVVDYQGTIHCCEVPNGLIYVRRNGKTLWTHNSYATSYRPQKIIESIAGGKKPQIIFAGHDHKSMYLFDRNIHFIASGTMQEQTSWMRGKRLAAHVGFWIIEMTVADGEVLRFSPTWYPYYV